MLSLVSHNHQQTAASTVSLILSLMGLVLILHRRKKKSSKFLGVFAQPKTSLDQHQTKPAIGHLNTIWLVVLVSPHRRQ